MIIRVKHDTHFTAVRNNTVRDSRLSFKATGLLVYLLSLPDDTRISRKELAGVKRDGEEAVRTALQELVRAGYLRRRVMRQPNGRTITETTLSEASDGATSARKTNTGKSSAGKSHSVRKNKGGAALQPPPPPPERPVPAWPSPPPVVDPTVRLVPLSKIQDLRKELARKRAQ